MTWRCVFTVSDFDVYDKMALSDVLLVLIASFIVFVFDGRNMASARFRNVPIVLWTAFMESFRSFGLFYCVGVFGWVPCLSPGHVNRLCFSSVGCLGHGHMGAMVGRIEMDRSKDQKLLLGQGDG